MTTRIDGTAPPGPVVTVSPMRRRHLRSVLAIEKQVYPRPWSARLFEDELERGGRAYLVARVGPTVVGYAGVLMIADDGHIATVAVDPVWQGHGVATRLLVELVRQAQLLGARQLTLEVRMSNIRAQEIYRRLGFVPGGARKGYYSDNGEDALVMWAHEVDTDEYEARLQAIEARLQAIEATIRPATDRRGFDLAPVFPEPAGGRVHPATRSGRMAGP